MPSTLQTVPLPQGEAWMFNHNRAELKALATLLGVENRLVIAHAIRIGLHELTTATAGEEGDDMDDLIAAVAAEVA